MRTLPRQLPADAGPAESARADADATAAAAPAGAPASTATRPAPADAHAAPGAPVRRRRVPRPGWRALGAVASGFTLYAATPPWGIWPLAAVGVAGLSLTVRGVRLRRSYGLGVLASIAFFLPLLTFTKTTGIDGWLVLTLAESLIMALLAPALTLTERLRGWPLWAACLWIGEEALRGRQPFGGFPWGRLAFSQPDTPSTRLASLGGAPLTSFAVALAGTLLAAAALRAWSARRTRRVWVGWGSVGLLLAGALGVSAVGLAVPLPTAAQDGNVVVAAIQGDVPAKGGVDALGRRLTVTRNHVRETEQLAAAVRAGKEPAPDLVLWPENSSDLDPFEEPEAAALLTEAAQAIDRPILVGAVLDGPGAGHVRNAGLVWGPDGYEGQMYVKQHPVPFGEYLPGRSWLQKVVKRFATDMPNDFVKGKKPGVIPLNGHTLGDVICFEVAYDGLVRSSVTHGGELLAVQTNNATFGLTGESPQQLAMARLRSIEHARSTVVVSTSGISAIMMPNGKVLSRTSRYTAATLVQTVPLRTSRTLADRVGVWPETVLVAVGVLALAGGIGLAVRDRRRRAARTGAEEGQG